MAKVKFEFDLEDQDDKDLFNLYCQAEDLNTAVWAFIHHDLRNIIKYEEDNEISKAAETVRQLLLDRLEEHQVSID